MYPELLKIGSISIKTYGFFVALGFIAGLEYIKKNSGKFGFDKNLVTDLSFYLLISGIIGARIFYVILDFHYYRNNLLDIFKVWQGGLVFYGGFIFSLVVGLIYCFKKNINIFKIFDLFAPGIFLGLSIGRLGCLCAGCCYGKETDLPWGIIFTNPECLAPIGKKIHPTQIYESIFCFINFLILNKKNNKKLFDGTTFFTGVLLYSVYRFLIEFLRGDDRGSLILGMYPSMFISIIIIIVSIIFFIYVRHKKISNNQTVLKETS